MTNKMIQQDQEVVTLADGRRLGYAKYGAPQGFPVLYFHGLPGSRLQRHPDISIASNLEVCMYGIDRPGIGLSTMKTQRTLLDWPDDVREFCDILRIEKCAVVGVSSGGPYALACAHKLGERVVRVAIASSFAPLDASGVAKHLDYRLRLLFSTAKTAPFILNGLMAIVLNGLGIKLENAFKYFVSGFSDADHRLFLNPEIREMFQADVAEAMRFGSQGVVNDLQVLAQPWGFSLNDIQQTVHLWHGRADFTVPIEMAFFMEKHLRNCEPHYIPTGGHFVALEKIRDILDLCR